MDIDYASSSWPVWYKSAATAFAITLMLKCKHIDSRRYNIVMIVVLFLHDMRIPFTQLYCGACMYMLYVIPHMAEINFCRTFTLRVYLTLSVMSTGLWWPGGCGNGNPQCT